LVWKDSEIAPETPEKGTPRFSRGMGAPRFIDRAAAGMYDAIDVARCRDDVA
jgi:hypothetical protein